MRASSTMMTSVARSSIRRHRLHLNATRGLATSLYAVGEGWTGALGTGRFDQMIAGHDDANDDAYQNGPEADMPVRMELPAFSYNNSSSDDAMRIQSVSVGWGHTAFVADNQLFITGRPHDFSNLLRLRRLPKILRDYSVKRSAQSALKTRDYDDQGLDPTSLVGRVMTYLSDAFLTQHPDWDAARMQSILAVPTPIDLPGGEIPVSVQCSAGVTSVITKSGALYSFGLNAYGQCGVGMSSNNVWTPQRVLGLSADYASGPRVELPQSFPIVDVRLGLQHALCLNSNGDLFVFGKGDRGQLGREPVINEQLWAVPVPKSFEVDMTTTSSTASDTADTTVHSLKPIYGKLKPIRQIAAGMLHSAALDEDNCVFIWGKNVLPKQFAAVDKPGAVAADARLPFRLKGLPPHLKVLQLSCGSHHTAVLLEDGSVWAVGVSSDTRQFLHDPVMMIPPGIVELPVRQFDSHMDRTTIVGNDGRQVLQVHLCEDTEMQEYAVFTPLWVDRLLEQDLNMKICCVHRSWIHTVIATE